MIYHVTTGYERPAWGVVLSPDRKSVSYLTFRPRKGKRRRG